MLCIELFSDIESKHTEQIENQIYDPKIIKLNKRGMDPNDFKNIELDSLYPDGKFNSDEKKKDLLQLLDYIPQCHHSFYANLRCSDEIDKAEEEIILSESE